MGTMVLRRRGVEGTGVTGGTGGGSSRRQAFPLTPSHKTVGPNTGFGNRHAIMLEVRVLRIENTICFVSKTSARDQPRRSLNSPFPLPPLLSYTLSSPFSLLVTTRHSKRNLLQFCMTLTASGNPALLRPQNAWGMCWAAWMLELTPTLLSLVLKSTASSRRGSAAETQRRVEGKQERISSDAK